MKGILQQRIKKNFEKNITLCILKNLQFVEAPSATVAMNFKLEVISKIDTAFENTGYKWYDANVFVAKVAKLYDRGFAILLTINTSTCVANCWAFCKIA